jgi:hypothetical protein
LNAENLAIKESEIKAKTEKQKFSFAVKEWPAYKNDFRDNIYRKAIRKIFEAGKDYKKLDVKLYLLRLLKSGGKTK